MRGALCRLSSHYPDPTLTDRLRGARVKVRDHTVGDAVEPGGARVGLVACNSAVPTVREQVLALIDRLSQEAARSLFVLDAASNKDFMAAVNDHKVQHVPYADQLHPSSLFVEVPALAELTEEGTKVG